MPTYGELVLAGAGVIFAYVIYVFGSVIFDIEVCSHYVSRPCLCSARALH